MPPITEQGGTQVVRFGIGWRRRLYTKACRGYGQGIGKWTVLVGETRSLLRIDRYRRSYVLTYK